MRKIYIDSDYKCHLSGDENMVAIETDFFDDKCVAFIEGYRFIPDGENWTRKDNAVFAGEMISPWRPYAELIAAQAQYEQDLADRAELEEAFNYLLNGGTPYELHG